MCQVLCYSKRFMFSIKGRKKGKKRGRKSGKEGKGSIKNTDQQKRKIFTEFFKITGDTAHNL